MTVRRSYPIPAPAADPRFTYGLVGDVMRVLAEHGYPRIVEGRDIVALQMALFGFLYTPQPYQGQNAPTGLRAADAPTEVLVRPYAQPGAPVIPGHRAAAGQQRRQICAGAIAGVEGDCGEPGPHGAHPMGGAR